MLWNEISSTYRSYVMTILKVNIISQRRIILMHSQKKMRVEILNGVNMNILFISFYVSLFYICIKNYNIPNRSILSF